MHFTNAILRVPAHTCASGLTTVSLGKPDFARTREQFTHYVNTLSDLNLTVTVLPANPDFPDSHFVEDTAVVLPELAIITHPGAPSREGEVATIEPVLSRFKRIERIRNGRMDGGDVLMVYKDFFVGLSARTNAAGIDEFSEIVEPLGYRVHRIEVSAGLHLKSIVNYIGKNTLLLNAAFSKHRAFSGFDRIVVASDEEYAGNTLWINDTLIMPIAYPRLLERLEKHGLPVICVPTSEFKKMDGGLTCLSLRF